MRLGVFGRAGIVASILWTIGCTYYGFHQDIDRRYDFVSAMFKECNDATDRYPPADVGRAINRCSQEMTNGFNEAASHRSEAFGSAFVGAVASLLFIWLAIWIVIATGRWILAGRK